jgi:hypothetical protein
MPNVAIQFQVLVIFVVGFGVCLRQGLSVQPKLGSNS